MYRYAEFYNRSKMRCKAMVHAGRIKIVVIKPQLFFFGGTNYTVNSFEPPVVS